MYGQTKGRRLLYRQALRIRSDISRGPRSGIIFPCTFFAVLFCLLTALPVRALSPDRPLNWTMLDSWTIDQGYLGKGTYDIFQDRDGFLWMGTENGLIRFDGQSFHSFNVHNVPRMRSNDVIDIAQTTDGSLWAATMDGVLRYRDGAFVRYGLEEGLPHRDAGVLHVNPDGVLWVGTIGGLAYWKSDHFVPVQLDAGDGSIFVVGILSDSDGRLWVMTEDTIIRFQEETAHQVFQDSKPILNGMAFDHDGTFWAATAKGVARLDPETAQLSFPPGLPAGAIRELMVDSRNALWLGTDREGVYRIHDGSVEHMAERDGLSGNTIKCLFEDRERSVWVGNEYRGIARFREAPFSMVDQRDGLPHRLVFCTVADRLGNIWAGTPEGLVRISPDGQVERIGKPMVVQALQLAADGTILVGTESKGLFRLNPGDRNPKLKLMGTGEREIYSMCEDDDGRILVGAMDGLFLLSDSRLIFSSKMFGLPSASIRSIVQTEEDIWIGTNDGLCIVRDDQTEHLRMEDGLSANFIFCIFPDTDGSVWLGTDQGLTLWRDGHLYPYRLRDGLPSNEIYAIVPDDLGQFWLSTEDGVVSVRRDALRRAVLDDADVRFHIYVQEDGIPNGEGIGGTQTTACRDTSGRIWIATISGLAMCDPANLKTNELPPPVAIEQVKLDDRMLSGDAVKLDPGWKRLRFTYAGLSFLVPERVRYRTMLAGYEDGWTERKDRTLSYTNLDPGDYVFRVHACNNDGVWSREPATFSFTVVRPWWNNWWFFGGLLVLLTVVLNQLWRGIRAVWIMFRQWQRSHVFGPYRILDLVGKGGMGTVYRARKPGDSTPVALKVLDADMTDDNSRKRFEREGMIGERIQHPGVVRILESGCRGDQLYYAMEFLDGQPLNRLMEKGLGPRTAVAISIVMLDILRDLHMQGVVHRDVKPQNVMMLKGLESSSCEAMKEPVERVREHLKLLDFGLARIFGATTLTRTGLMAGTLQYLPPESFAGKMAVSPKTDFYAVGIVLYEMLTGLKPYHGEDLAEVMYAVLYRSVAAPHEVVPGLPRKLSQLAMSMIDKDPEARLRDYGEIRKRLSEELSGIPPKS